MKARFYYITDSHNTINKTLNAPVETRDLLFLSQFDSISPTISVKDLPNDINYLYIDELQKYYFIDNVQIKNNNLFILNLSLDVLKTYESIIENLIVKINQIENPLSRDNLSLQGKKSFYMRKIDFQNQPFQNTSTNVLECVIG